MKALITGGAGFIGSHLCDALVAKGYHITIIDNLFRGKYENIANLINKNNSFYKIDLSDFKSIDDVSQIILSQKPDLIFHYAAINGTQYFYDIPSKVVEANSLATLNLMQAIKKSKNKNITWKPKILFASSSEVYGEPLTIPTKENDIIQVDINRHRDSYAVSKIVGEFYIKLMSEEAHINWIILRLFNVYGPRMIGTKYGQVIPEFISRLKNGEYPLTIYGNGEHKRSFCHIKDNIACTIKLAESDIKNEVFNIGNIHEISIKELAVLIMEKMHKIPLFSYLPERNGDHKRRCPDIKKLQGVIKVDDFISLNTGLDELIDKEN
jgi:nucleoside-diphosphate-sugar epimerase